MRKVSGKKRRQQQSHIAMPIMNPNAAGIDIGSRLHHVCIGQKKGEVQEFGHFTENLHEIAKHLQKHGIKTVAMESTGYYCKPLFLMLQDYGFEVILVNARHIKNVKGKKTDVVDSRWIQLLHSLGLLTASFQLDNLTEELKVYSRQRRYLLNNRSRYKNKMHKALVMMNIQVGTVLTDLMGISGQRIIEAILAGERNPAKLATLAHKRVNADKATIIKSLEGTWRAECLFELQVCVDAYDFFTKKIKDCDKAIQFLLETEVARNNDGCIDVLDDFKPAKKKAKE